MHTILQNKPIEVLDSRGLLYLLDQVGVKARISVGFSRILAFPQNVQANVRYCTAACSRLISRCQELKPMRHLHVKNVAGKARFATEGGQEYHYRLEITKIGASRSPKTVCVVMQEPSYAGKAEADKSLQCLEKNVFELGLPEFEGVERLVVVNQFARIQTNGFVGLTYDLGAYNNEAIETTLIESEIVVNAWGSGNRFDARKAFILDLASASIEGNCIHLVGVTRGPSCRLASDHSYQRTAYGGR
jgi:hypothetical protein